jgi:predicted N-acetyltransferase YhbS
MVRIEADGLNNPGADTPMTITLREGRADDAAECGRICFEAFRAIAAAHDFPPDMPSVEIARRAVAGMLVSPDTWGVVAEEDGRIVGSNFLVERQPISGVGPITVDPTVQNKGVGALLMTAVMERSAAKGFAGIRLVQAGYHTRSLSLYSKLGFEVREPLSCFQGPALNRAVPGYAVRPAAEADAPACNRLCAAVHGVSREGELRDATAFGAATVVERGGRITGYATQIAFFGHAVAETTDDLTALIAAAPSFGGPGFLVPSRNGALMRWCLGEGLKVVQPMTLMTMGLYGEPQGAWLPSVLY